MTKEWELTVQRPLKEKPGVVYPMRILQIKKGTSKDKTMVVTLQHRKQPYLGQLCHLHLPITIRGSGHPTAQFFAACGMDVHLNAKLKPKQVIGRALGVVFAPNLDTGEPEPVMFTHLKQEIHHDERPESQSTTVVS